MPLPGNNTPWPPTSLAQVAPKQAEWSAWYDGSAEALRGVYQTAQTANFDRPSQRRGGVSGALARFWWGRPLGNVGGMERVDQLHIPIASDICQASADMLYAEPPDFTIASKDQSTIDFIEELQGQVHSVLAAGAEVGAALGGRYHRVTWDATVIADRCFLSTVDADMALPTFRWDRLIEVTFWKVIQTEGQTVIRHLEHHELDLAGNGVVQHALYVGTVTNLGRAVPLTEHPSTASLATQIDADGYLREGRTPGLLVEYVPNQRPNRRWRTDPVGRSLGRSDLDGIEPTMDALDEVYSSWMRDVRLAKGRVFIPSYMMDMGKPGQGSSFDLDREIYVPLRSAAPEDADAKLTINQFDIRVAEHQATAQELTEVILRSAGYSSQTFGEMDVSAAMTATEVSSRERRTYLTRDRKIRLEKPAVSRLLHKMLTVQTEVFKTHLDTTTEPQVSFGDAVQESPLRLAQTALALDQAGAASTRVKVQIVHPDWKPDQVDEEVGLIQDAAPLVAPSPF
jgi:A118 family predicted phage portal protein